MDGIGGRLRAMRQSWAYSLREVEDRSSRLAQECGNPSYRISASWLDRVEREDRGLSAAKLIVLAAIYGLSPDQLLQMCPGASGNPAPRDPFTSPNATVLLPKGPMDDQARLWLPDSVRPESVPEQSALVPGEQHLPSHYRRGIVGRRDTSLAPMVRSGTIVLINTQKRTVASRREWINEFDRPIYFLITHQGYLCGWIDLDKAAEWVTLIPHPLSYAVGKRWKYRKEVEVVGRVVAMLLRLDTSA